MSLNLCYLLFPIRMKSVVKLYILSLSLCFFCGSITAQSSSEKLKNEQQRLEKHIANTKQLLKKTQSNVAFSLRELELINNQIAYRERLIHNFDMQIRGAELKIREREQKKEQLSQEITTLKDQYKQLLLYAYKHRNRYGKMMFIFSAENYYKALKRIKYLEKIQELIAKQLVVIEQHQKLIDREIDAIRMERERKMHLLEEKRKERREIVIDQQKQQEIYRQLHQQEHSIKAQLKEEEQKRVRLKSQIDAAIKKELTVQRSKTATKTETVKSGSANKSKDKQSGVVLSTTAEASLNRSFEENRGRLPWPVEKGTITEGYGTNPHPTIVGVVTQNNGVDIAAPKNSHVRAVFDGEVSSVITIAGSGKVIIIKHGNYRTVYGNLQQVFVKVGSKVSTKQVIGSLVASNQQTLSTSHFEIHRVSGGSVTSLNPNLWLAK